MATSLSIKALGKKGELFSRSLTLPSSVTILQDLIEHIVQEEVIRYNEGATDTAVKLLTQKEMEEESVTGKVYQEKKSRQLADPDEAIALAYQSFSDGLFKVFINEAEMTSLSQTLPKDIKSATFLKLVSLTGGYLW